MLYIGIDPGKAGGIVALDETGAVVSVTKLDATEHDIVAAIRELLTLDTQAFAAIEQVNAMPAFGKNGERRSIGATSAFTFGRGYGFLRGCLAALQIPFEEVTPRKWQAALGCLSGGDKNKTKAKAQKLWPHRNWTHAISDAALIAEYNRRVRTGQLATLAAAST